MENLLHRKSFLRAVVVFFSSLMIATILVPTSTALAQGNDNTSQSTVTEQPEEYLENLAESDKFVENKLAEISNQGFQIDPKVKSIEGSDFIYYTNEDTSTYGLLQLTDTGHTSLEMIINDNETLESAVFQDGNENNIYIENNGDNTFDVSTGTSSGATTFSTASTLCSILTGLAGSGISYVYTRVAGILGGPVATAVVSIINTVGWSYVSAQC